MYNFPTKRDYWYSFSIAVIIGVFLVVSFVTNLSKLNSELGLVATISSIILSAIAIIITLVDSSNNKNTTQKIIDSSNTIEDVTVNIDKSTQTLSNLTKDLADLQIDKKLNTFQEMLSELETAMLRANESVMTDIGVMKDTIIKSVPESGTSTVTDFKESDVRKIGIDLIKNLSEQYYHAHETLYYAFKTQEYDKPLFPYLAQYISSNYKYDDDTLVEHGKAYCLLGILTYFKCINWDVKTSKVTFFEEEIKPFINKFEENNKEKAENIINYIQKI